MLQGYGVSNRIDMSEKQKEYLQQLIVWLLKEKIDTSNPESRKTIDSIIQMRRRGYITNEDRIAINIIIGEHNKWVRNKKEQERLDSLDELTWAM